MQDSQQPASAFVQPSSKRQKGDAASGIASPTDFASPRGPASPTAVASPSGITATARKTIASAAAAVRSTATAAADTFREAPQRLGNKINDALPGSSKKQASSRQQAASTAATESEAKAGSTEEGGSDATRATSSHTGKNVTSETMPNAAEQQVKDVLAGIARARSSVTGSKGNTCCCRMQQSFPDNAPPMHIHRQHAEQKTVHYHVRVQTM